MTYKIRLLTTSQSTRNERSLFISQTTSIRRLYVTSQPHNLRVITNGILGDALTKNAAKQRLSGRLAIIRYFSQTTSERLYGSYVTS
jgi:hypothetical protein